MRGIIVDWKPKTLKGKFLKGIVVGLIYGTLVPVGVVLHVDRRIADKRVERRQRLLMAAVAKKGLSPSTISRLEHF